MSQGPLCPNLTKKVQKEVSQIANRNLPCPILFGGLSVNLNHLKKQPPPPLKYTANEDGTGDSSNLPSTIFGSPETSSSKMPGDAGDSSSDISESELDNILDRNLNSMRSHLEASQKLNISRKRQFFESMLKGKDYLHYLLHYVT